MNSINNFIWPVYVSSKGSALNLPNSWVRTYWHHILAVPYDVRHIWRAYIFFSNRVKRTQLKRVQFVPQNQLYLSIGLSGKFKYSHSCSFLHSLLQRHHLSRQTLTMPQRYSTSVPHRAAFSSRLSFLFERCRNPLSSHKQAEIHQIFTKYYFMWGFCR